VIRSAVEVMREDVERRHPRRNPSHIARWESDLDLLHRALFHGDRLLTQAEAARLRRLATVLGVDLPGRHPSRHPLPVWPEDYVVGAAELAP